MLAKYDTFALVLDQSVGGAGWLPARAASGKTKMKTGIQTKHEDTKVG